MPLTIDLFGGVGEPFEGFTEADVADQLKDYQGDGLTVRINSPGGFAFDGIAIYNLLKEHNPTIQVVGLAASAASVIAMAGEVELMQGAQLMIHDPWGGIVGNADNLRSYADEMDRMAEDIADIYANRPGVDRNEIRQAMRDETWYRGDEAIEAGLADHSSSGKANIAAADSNRVLAMMGCKTVGDEPKQEETRKLEAQVMRWAVKRKTTGQ